MTTTAPTFLVVGATSGIARALSARLAARGWSLVLAARDAEEVRRLAKDLEVRFRRSVPILAFDATDSRQAQTMIQQALSLAPNGLDGVVVCHGMTPHDAGERDDDILREAFEVNFMSAAMIVNAAADYFQPQQRGTIAAISSVAGDRGRQSNFIYGAAKAALTVYLQGLRNRLHPIGVHVLTVKPGFVDTPMTQGMKVPARFLVARADRVAADIERALLRRRDTIYTPWFWRPIMAAIRMIPEALFKRLKL